MGNKMKASKYLWCTLTIAVTAACATIIYMKITTGTKKESTYETSGDYFSSPEKIREEECISVCETKECVYQSKILLDNINPDVNPCEDFHRFACGRSFDKFDENEIYGLDDRLIGNVLLTKIKHILDGIEAESESASGKLKTVYDSCMAYSSNEFQAVPTVLEFLDNLGIQNWPNLESDFRFTSPSITEAIAYLLLYQEYGFIQFSTSDEYIRMEAEAITGVKANGSLTSPESFYETQDKPTRKYLVNRILDYFKVDGKTINDIWEELEAIHDAIVNLREESMRMVEENEYGTPTLLDCRQGAEKEWEDICESIKSLIETAVTTDEVNEDFASINSEELHFMQNIFPLLRNFTDRSIGNYLAINVFLNNLNDLPSYFHLSRKKEDESTVQSMRPPLLKWRKCANWLRINMAIALGHEYVTKDFTLPMIRDIEDLANECIKESSDLIPKQDWIKNVTYRQALKERVAAIRIVFNMVYEMLPNETKINNFYDMIQYEPTDVSFMHNVFEYKKSMKIVELRGLFNYDTTVRIGSLLTLEALGGSGDIDIFFGLMLPPFYVPGSERLMNLLTMGVIITHELGHNLEEFFNQDLARFDPEGSEYYQEQMQCVRDQYSRFRFESTGKNLNGNRTIRENFGDTVAISVMDKIIEKYASQNTTHSLPASSYSLTQQMYIYSAQLWCSLSNKEKDEYFHDVQTHTLEKYRLLGQMQNSKGFSEAFGCPAGSYLNPVTKCSFLE